MPLNFAPIGKLIVDIRSDADVAAIVGQNPTVTTPRVRSPEPGPGDAQPAGSYRAFVVLVNLGGPFWRTVPIHRPRIAVKCFGRTQQEADALASAVYHAVHWARPRMHGNGLGIFNSRIDSGGEQDKDPDTQQPFATVYIDPIVTTLAVTA